MKFAIVVSIRGRSLAEMVTKARKVADDVMFEFRLDSISEEYSKDIGNARLPESMSQRSILTYRVPNEGGMSRDYSVDRLIQLIRSCSSEPPAFVDVESSSIDNNLVAAELKRYSGRLIISSHLADGGTSVEGLFEHWLRWKGAAHYIKVINMPATLHEALLSLELYGLVDPLRLISFSAGKRWSFTRFTSVFLGSPLFYSCLPGEPLADGQPTVQEAVKFKKAIEDGA
ncbi:MAG: type I 3-dehydroquinate dehydratase [Nitrososphaerota archaeon]|nr:type I 3-dehydroquinate dehydratase [Nitrososphaerota archaeon]